MDCHEMSINMESMEEIQKFIDELVIDVLKMKKVGKAHYEYFEDSWYNHIRGIVGYSVVQVISEFNSITSKLYTNIMLYSYILLLGY